MQKNDSDFFERIIRRPEKLFFENSDLHSYFGNKRILIVGAAGSIGSAITNHLVNSGIDDLYLLDHDESALHHLVLSNSLNSRLNVKNCFIADVRDAVGIKEALGQIEPTVVIHTAALKHLTTLERFPREGYLSNVIGTMNVAEICRDLGIEQFVNISTDKAAKPTSILGNTKKLGELLTEEIFVDSKTKYCSVRFGNVFASRGSVIETFINQIMNGIPVTLSDKNVSRFFMSEKEAANLVLAASTLEKGGTYIQDMGKEVKIIDIIERLFEFFKTRTEINLIGLYPGEKLHEDLYDGPVSSTKFSSIVRSEHSIKKGLVAAIKERPVGDNSEVITVLKNLTMNFVR